MLPCLGGAVHCCFPQKLPNGTSTESKFDCGDRAKRWDWWVIHNVQRRAGWWNYHLSFPFCVFCTLTWECLGPSHCELGWLPAPLVLSLGGLILRNVPSWTITPTPVAGLILSDKSTWGKEEGSDQRPLYRWNHPSAYDSAYWIWVYPFSSLLSPPSSCLFISPLKLAFGMPVGFCT